MESIPDNPPFMMAVVLQEIIDQTDNYPYYQAQITKFHATRVPGVTIKQYLSRVVKYAHCSDCCFIFALIYIDRIIERQPQFIINSLNIHRLIITTILLAAKFYDDFYLDNEYYSQIGGISNLELNSLEIECLRLINFNLYIHPSLFYKYLKKLKLHTIKKLREEEMENLSPCPMVSQTQEEEEKKKQVEPEGHSVGPVTDQFVGEEEQKQEYTREQQEQFYQMQQIQHLRNLYLMQQYPQGNPHQSQNPDLQPTEHFAPPQMLSPEEAAQQFMQAQNMLYIASHPEHHQQQMQSYHQQMLLQQQQQQQEHHHSQDQEKEEKQHQDVPAEKEEKDTSQSSSFSTDTPMEGEQAAHKEKSSFQ